MCKLVNSMRLLFLFIAMVNFTTANTQSLLKHASNKYENLYHSLYGPDSMYVYELSPDGSDGVAYFICYKNSIVKSGYFLSENYFNNLLVPRSLMPKDSLSKMFRIVEANGVDVGSVISNIQHSEVFDFQKMGYHGCVNDIDDGLYYRLTKYINDSFSTMEYYEVYEAAKNCPQRQDLQVFIQIDKLFRKHFGEPETISQNLLEEYRKRKK